jgi:hypothetical protein
VQRKKKWFALSVALVLVLSLGVGCRRQPTPPGEPNEESDGQEETPGETEEQFFCPLDGLPVTDPELVERRPLAVMIGNIPGLAEPSGLDKACLVFEILTEGGITRLMPVFLHQDAPLLGSVRSARHYFLDKALEFNAAYSHCGYSPQAKQDISSLKVISLNEFYLPQVYWRVRTKKEPHNVYTSTERLFAELERRGLLTAPSPVQFSFYDDNCQPLGPGAKKAALRFSPNYVVEYRWDEAAGGYARFVNGKPQQDEHSGQQLVAKNVLVQFVDGTKVLDAEGRLDMKLVGQGGGRMFQQGVTYELNWSKRSRTEPTSWTDKNGQSIRLIRGQSWIEVLPHGAEVTWE